MCYSSYTPIVRCHVSFREGNTCSLLSFSHRAQYRHIITTASHISSHQLVNDDSHYKVTTATVLGAFIDYLCLMRFCWDLWCSSYIIRYQIPVVYTQSWGMVMPTLTWIANGFVYGMTVMSDVEDELGSPRIHDDKKLTKNQQFFHFDSIIIEIYFWISCLRFSWVKEGKGGSNWSSLISSKWFHVR